MRRPNGLLAIALLVLSLAFVATTPSEPPADEGLRMRMLWQPTAASIEFLVAHADGVILGEALPGDQMRHIRVIGVLRGEDPGPELQFSGQLAVTMYSRPRGHDWPPGEPSRVLLFIQDVSRGQDGVTFGGWFLPLDGVQPAIGLDLEWLVDAERILAAVRQAVQYELDIARSIGRLDQHQVDWADPTGQWRWHMTITFPVDQRLESAAQKWARSAEWRYRQAAASALGRFPTAENVELLWELAADTAVTPESTLGRDRWRRYVYPVRTRAALELVRLDPTAAARIDAVGPYVHYRPVEWRRAWWLAVPGVLGACVLLSVSVGWLGGKLGSGCRPTGGLVRRTMVVLCLVLGATVSFVWFRSHRTVDELMFASAWQHHQVASHRGAVQYTRVSQWMHDVPALRGRFPLDEYDHWWAMEALGPGVAATADHLLGFVVANGTTDATIHGSRGWAHSTHPAQLIRIPYWPLLVILLILPALSLRRAIRHHRRLRRGLCAQCGYDLRESPGRCPECGATVASHADAAASAG